MELEDQEREIQLENEPIIYAGSGAVNSVNGYTGDVVLTTSDLQNTSDYQTGTEVDTAIQEAIANLPQDFITLTDDDANYQNPETGEDVIALWLLDGGKYLLDKDATVGIVPRLVQYDGDWVPENLEFTEENPIMLVDKEGAFVYVTVVSSTGNFKAIVESATGHTSSFAKFAQVAFMGATSSANGEEGLVPAPTTSDVNKFLKGDGTWGTVAVPNVVQTTGSSITDVMSQNAVTQALSSLSVIKILTDDDANWTNPDTGDEYIASWLLEKGIYALAEDATIPIASYVENEGGETVVANEYSSSDNPVLWTSGYNSDDPTSYVDITTIANVSSCYYTVNGSGEIDEFSWFVPSVFIGTNGNDDGVAGLVPAPATTDAGKFLKADGTWDDAGGGVTELTSADYNWPESNPDGIAIWKLKAGLYYQTSNTKIYVTTSVATSLSGMYIYVATDDIYANVFYGNINNGWVKSSYNISSGDRLTQTTFLNSAEHLVQTTGTSTTSVMSQDAVSGLLFNEKTYKEKIRIGGNITLSNVGNSSYLAVGEKAKINGANGTALGAYAEANGDSVAVGASSFGGLPTKASGAASTAIGYNAKAQSNGSIALGAHSTAANIGEMNIGSSVTNYGYNSSNYRLLSGLYDGQSAHDAATYGQVISYSAINGAGAPTTATEGKYVGQLYYDTTNEAMYFLKTIDTTTTPTTYTWEALGGGSSVNVVQTNGTSTTDVMSQKAVTDLLFHNNLTQKVQIGSGADSSFTGNGSAIAIGSSSRAAANNTIAIGTTASALASDTITLGRDSSSAASATNSVAIGRLSSATGENAVAIGARATATQKGQFDISTGTFAWGYNNSNYRLLTGLYDPQSAHDAATKGYVDAISSYSETEADTGATWIDGKTIYKKSYQQTITANSQSFNLNITNLYEIVKIEAIWHVGGTLTNGLPTTFATTSSINDNVTVLTYGGMAEITSNGRNGMKGVITFYYTKSS